MLELARLNISMNEIDAEIDALIAEEKKCPAALRRIRDMVQRANDRGLNPTTAQVAQLLKRRPSNLHPTMRQAEQHGLIKQTGDSGAKRWIALKENG